MPCDVFCVLYTKLVVFYACPKIFYHIFNKKSTFFITVLIINIDFTIRI